MQMVCGVVQGRDRLRLDAKRGEYNLEGGKMKNSKGQAKTAIPRNGHTRRWEGDGKAMGCEQGCTEGERRGC